MGDVDPIDRPTRAEQAVLEKYMSRIYRNTRPGNGQTWVEYVSQTWKERENERVDQILVEAVQAALAAEDAVRGKFKSRPGPVKPFEEV